MTRPRAPRDGTGRLRRPVAAVLLGGAASTVIVWGLELVVTVPGAVAAAVTTLATFAAGYLTSDE
jgi:hypothetical protein